MSTELEKVKRQWDEHAHEWNRWIGDDGDENRRESSDICLWKYIGDVENKVVLDAGCGNGYLTIKFAQQTRAQRIVAVDLSDVLIELAKSNADRRILDNQQRNRIVFNQDSVTELKSIESNSIDLIVANYVLMDTPHLELIIQSFKRVLRPLGRVVIVILHPCFDILPQKDGQNRIYKWSRSYFDQTPEIQEWANFSLNIYHRPLSVYFEQFHRNQFTLKDFDEPKFFSRVHQYDFTCAVIFHLQKNVES